MAFRTISGASFELQYPVEMLRLQGQGHPTGAGEMVAKNAAARYMWNVEPEHKTTTATQDGTIGDGSKSVLSQWSIKEGVSG